MKITPNKITRRGLLKGTAAVGLAGSLPQALPGSSLLARAIIGFWRCRLSRFQW